MHMRSNKEDLSLGELFSELSDGTRTLIRQEIELAKIETSRKVSLVGKDVAYIAAGGVIAFAGFLALIATLIIALAYIIPLWLSALLVGSLTAGAGYFLIEKGRGSLKREKLIPERTTETLKETKEWARSQMT